MIIANNNAKLKLIKRFKKIVLRFLLALVLFFLLAIILLSLSVVQTRLGKIATNYLNDTYKTNIVVEKVGLTYLGNIDFKNIEILDHHQDSLINIKSLSASIFNYRNIIDNKLEFGDIDLDGVNFIIRTYKGENNDSFSIFTDKFEDENEDDSPSDFLLTSTNIYISNGNIKILDENIVASKAVTFRGLKGNIYSFKIQGPTIIGQVDGLQFVENHGIAVTSLTSGFTYSKQEMKLMNSSLKTETSSLLLNLVFHRNGSFSDFNNNVKFDAEIWDSSLSLYDLNKFYGELGQSDVLHFKTNLSGTLNDFTANDLRMNSNLNSIINGDFHVKNAFNTEKGFSINAAISNLTSDYNHLKNLLPNILENSLPSIFKELGRFKISGTSFITPELIDTKLQMNSDLGTTISDLRMTNIDDIDNASYEGYVKIIDFELGKFAKDSLIGKLSLEANIKGKGFTLEGINTSIKGKIFKHQYKGYSYKNIEINGQFQNKKFIGKLTSKDENLVLNFNGLADLSTDIYKFDFKSQVVFSDFNKLNLFKRDSISILKGDIDMKLEGNSIDDLAGEVSFKYASYTNQNDEYLFKDFNITSSFKDSVRTLTFNSADIVNGEVEGIFKFNELVNLTRNSIGSIYANYEPFPVTSGQYLDFNFKIYNKIVEVFFPEVSLGTNTSIKGKINSDDDTFKLSLNSPKIDIYQNTIDNIKLQIDNKNPLFNTQLSVDNIHSDYYDVSELDLVNVTLNDTLFFRTEFVGGVNKTEKYNLGFYHTIDANNRSVVGVNRSDFTFRNTTWLINPNENSENKAVFDTGLSQVDFYQFDLVSENQKIGFHGSKKGEFYKDLNFTFENVNLTGITPEIDDWNFAGLINGKVEYNQNREGILPIANVKVEDFFVNETFLGDLTIGMKGVNSIEKFDLEISTAINNYKNLVVIGNVDLSTKKPTLALNIDFEEFKLDFLKPIGDENFTNIRGFVYGSTQLSGLLANPTMSGELFLDSAGVAFPYLNVDYDFEGTTVLELSNQTFKIVELTLHDIEDKTRGELLGSISHTGFSDWKLDLSLSTKNLLVLNTQETEDALYYGKGLIEGNATIAGFTDNLSIDVFGKTNKDTYFVIPLSDVKTINNTKLVTFVSEENETQEFQLPNEVLLKKFKGLTLNFNLEVTKDAIVEMVIDKATGSTLKGSGTGDLRIEIDTKGKFNMFGDFVIENGTYDFKYGGFVNKQFVATRGGTILWEGSPYTAELDIETVYRVYANPKSILENLPTSRNIPIDLVTRFSGELYNSQKEYDILIPDVDSNIKSELDFKLNNNDSNNQLIQFSSLLVSGSFFNENDIGANSTAFLTGTGSQLLSNVLSNIIGGNNENFKLGVDYRAGDNRSTVDNLNTDDQIGLTVATRLNDRILIDGKVGVPVGSKEQSGIRGEVNVEFLLNEEGTLRSTAFNRQNEIQYTEEEEGYTQGLGLTYQFDFDNGGELLEKLGIKKKKVENDSLKTEKNSIPPKKLVQFGSEKY